MFKTVAIALSTALAAIASPALADVARTTETTTAQVGSAAPADALKAKPVSAKQRYCVSDTHTGSRIVKKTCQTREQWMKQGFDPLAAK